MYQYSISLYGKFIFRTEWIDNRTNAEIVGRILKEQFRTQGYKITMNYKSPSQWSIDLDSADDINKAIEVITRNS